MKQHIYPVLAAHRRMLGLSQQQLAALAGLRREKVCRIESKGEDIGLEDLARLLDALGLELSVSEKGRPNSSRSPALFERVKDYSVHLEQRRLAPQDFRKAAFIDGARAKILHWGKVPK